jgi:hypothetical protein
MTCRGRMRTVLAVGALAVMLLTGCGGGNPVNTGPFGGAAARL